MTRETLPRFDLYGELEVSPFASVGTIEAAYRALVKQHHPDVASGDESRMTRLNLAREWLADPELRHRYDRETDRGREIPEPRRPVATHSVVTRSHADQRAAGGWSTPGGRAAAAPRAPTSVSRDSEPTFGIHAGEVRQFLAELRSLDRARAQRVWNGRAVAHTKGYTQTLRAAASAARGERHAEWQFAREAAAVIARGKLGDSTLSDQVADVLSDVAGAIAIRDLLSPGEFALILMPWTWRGTVRMPEGQAVEDRASLDNRIPLETAGAMPAAATLAAALATVPKPATPISAPASIPSPVPIQAAATPAVAPAMPVAPAKPSTPFVAAAPPPRQAPSWPAQPAEPRARPPIDPAVADRVAAALATTPLASTANRPAAAVWSPPVRATPGPVARHEPAVRAAVFAPPPRRRIGSFPMVLGGASFVLLLASAILIFPGSKPNQVVAAATDAPTDTLPGVAFASEPPATIDPATAPGSTEQPPATTDPTAVGGGTGPTPLPPAPGATPRPTRPPVATPRPTPPGQTPPPTPVPTPTSAPTPTPTPAPTDTPAPTCTVITLINHWTFNAQHQWTNAGFTGTVIFDPSPPPDYHIKSQSLAIGTIVPCSSDITVYAAP